jgi:hypothetical protein
VRRARERGDASPSRERGATIGSLDPSNVYRQAGLIVQGDPLPFVGSVHFMAGRSPDTTLVLVTASLPNRALTFTSDGTAQRAAYSAVVELQQGARTVTHVETRQVVRVASFKETSRSDESLIFQQPLAVPPGRYSLTLTLRDEGSANAGAQQAQLVVPRLGAGTLSSPVVVYQAVPRASADSAPAMIANPRSTVVFGRDSAASVYLEGYALASPPRVALAVLNDRRATVWRDTVSLTPHGALASAVVDVPVARVGVGQLTLTASAEGSAHTVREPLFVTFGEELGIATFDELLNYLRYFATPERLQALRDAPPEQRAAAWAAFWKESDPAPSTPEQGVRHARRARADPRSGRPGRQHPRARADLDLRAAPRAARLHRPDRLRPLATDAEQ